jgi:hypothetical protein
MSRYPTETERMKFGAQIGFLTILGPAPKEGRSVRFNRLRCQCVCGRIDDYQPSVFKFSKRPSCGCKRKDTVGFSNLTHGSWRNPEYRIWCHLRSRCSSPSNTAYPNYGGRGITVCARWLGKDGFENFLADVGPRPSKRHSIDRIDNDGNYEPGNVRWATPKEQARNRRNCVLITFAGKTQTAKEWAIETGIPHNRILDRARKGWSPERTLS